MIMHQLPMFVRSSSIQAATTQEKLHQLLSTDLDFHRQDSSYASHNFHAFPAKYPPQLPKKFIQALTDPGDSVLDPMMGSGTTLVEAYLSHRTAIGLDIDPLAVKLVKVKTTPLDKHKLLQTGNRILKQAIHTAQNQVSKLEEELEQRLDSKTLKFINYWFAKETQIDLFALIREIEQIEDEATRTFFEIVFSATIITKSGGVSLAFDLAHTRPHRAKIVYDPAGKLILGEDLIDDPSPRLKILTKKLRSVFDEFGKRFQKNLTSLPVSNSSYLPSIIKHEDSQNTTICNDSIDLIVTSPPYASNAIDYMRAHKFSLVWLGYSVDDLGQKRGEYIGGESTSNFEYEPLPNFTTQVVNEITEKDKKKGLVLHRYYSEMTRVLHEMHRILKPGKVAILVVGSSVMRGRDTETGNCLADIGDTIGFETPQIGIRNLDRNRRMLPAGMKIDKNSQIQQRMHQEYVIGYVKSAT